MNTAFPLKRRTKAFARLCEMKNLHHHLLKQGNPSGKPVLEKDQISVQKEFEKHWKKVNKA